MAKEYVKLTTMILINDGKQNYGINFPTDVAELTPEVLDAITGGVKLPKYHCIVALAFKTKLFDFCTMLNSKKNNTIGVVPLLAKISDEDAKGINAEVGDRVIIDRSTLERGVHLKLNTKISSDNAQAFFRNNADLINGVLHNSIEELPAATNIVILEFKIIAVNDISASMPVGYVGVDPFMRLTDAEN